MLRATADKVVVRVTSPEKTTKSGIILPAGKDDRLYEGTVISVGDATCIDEQGVSVGAYVYYEKGMNFEVTEDGVLHDVVSVFDIFAKRED